VRKKSRAHVRGSTTLDETKIPARANQLEAPVKKYLFDKSDAGEQSPT
jgi:hypothetical protein